MNFRLIKELAIYEREPDAVHITEETLRRDGWAGDGTAHTSPRFYCFLAVENIPSAPEMVIGMALFFTSYSTWKGMCCYLEDLIVTNTHRGRGIGEALISAVGNMCLILDMPRLSWQCLKWNEKSLAFYSSLGAVAMSDWENLRMTKDTMLCTFGENKGLTDIAATVSPPPTLQTTLTWGSAFATANEVFQLLHICLLCTHNKFSCDLGAVGRVGIRRKCIRFSVQKETQS